MTVIIHILATGWFVISFQRALRFTGKTDIASIVRLVSPILHSLENGSNSSTFHESGKRACFNRCIKQEESKRIFNERQCKLHLKARPPMVKAYRRDGKCAKHLKGNGENGCCSLLSGGATTEDMKSWTFCQQREENPGHVVTMLEQTIGTVIKRQKEIAKDIV
eukprot:Seg1619.7 transcript_id=Seg1619.7/GoldUCD/mRNA.D3Y31 product="hypothetical protein" protein_id=Seg1619.7/GoldUCD/D3Y31